MATRGNSHDLARKRTIAARGHKCEHCNYPGSVELHHIIEFKNGGTHDADNLLLLCEKCHAEAHGHTKRNYLDKNREFWSGENGR